MGGAVLYLPRQDSGYPVEQPALMTYARCSLPSSQDLYARGLCLPVQAALTNAAIDGIADSLRRVHANRPRVG